MKKGGGIGKLFSLKEAAEAGIYFSEMRSRGKNGLVVNPMGDGGVGKTSLITRFISEQFISSYTATIGVDFKSKVILIDQKYLKLQIWDTAGQERFRNITQAYYRGASGIILSFSLADKLSFQNVTKWISQLEEVAPKDICKILVGCKNDMKDRVISKEEGEKLAIKMGTVYIETSAKTGLNVAECFQCLGKQINLRKNQAQQKQGSKLKSTILMQEQKTCSC